MFLDRVYVSFHIISKIVEQTLGHRQRDQMARLFFNIWTFATMKV